jgi:hypothetical protein
MLVEGAQDLIEAHVGVDYTQEDSRRQQPARYMADLGSIAGRFGADSAGVYIFGYIARGRGRSAQSCSTVLDIIRPVRLR